MPSFPGRTADGENVPFAYDVRPDKCPICHRAVNPHPFNVAGAKHNINDKSTTYEAVFQCTANACGRVFIARYFAEPRMHGGPLIETYPCEPEPNPIADEVREVSPTFCEVYDQSMQALSLGLDQIAGGGLRKALEFLIKDFCTLEHAGDAEAEAAIKDRPLKQVIESYVDDHRLKSAASRAAWLGNDEMHYVRKWTEHDVHDLKILVKLAEGYVCSSRIAKRYEDELQIRDKQARAAEPKPSASETATPAP